MKKTLVECLLAFLCIAGAYEVDGLFSSSRLKKSNSTNDINTGSNTGTNTNTQTSGTTNSSITPSLPAVLPSQPAAPITTPQPDQTTTPAVPDQAVTTAVPSLPQPDTSITTLPSLETSTSSGLSQSTPNIGYVPILDDPSYLGTANPNAVNWSNYPNAKQMISEATTMSNFNKKLYKRVKKGDRIRPIFLFTKALRNSFSTKKQTTKKRDTALATLSKITDPMSELEMVAIRQLAIFLNDENELNALKKGKIGGKNKIEIAKGAAKQFHDFADKHGLLSIRGL